MYCLTCDAEKHPTQVYTSKGLVDACPSCQGVFARIDPDAERQVTWPDATKIVAAVSDVAAHPSGHRVLPLVAPRPVPKAAEPTAWGSLIDQARARLAFCEEQIAARDGFIAERDKLRGMLAAADGETRPEPPSVFTN